MPVIGTITDEAGTSLPVELVTWCKATYGALVYDVLVNGERFQLDLPDKIGKEDILKLVESSYRSIKAAKEEAAAQPEMVMVEVPKEDADAIKEMLASKGDSVLVAVPKEQVDVVQDMIRVKPVEELL